MMNHDESLNSLNFADFLNQEVVWESCESNEHFDEW